MEGDPPGPLDPGMRACTKGSGAATVCATGRVRNAIFTPSALFTARQRYDIELNPEHYLDVTDLAGNPFDRDTFGFLATSRDNVVGTTWRLVDLRWRPLRTRPDFGLT